MTFYVSFFLSSIQNLCFKRVCSPSKFLVNGSCVPVFTQVKGVVKDYHFIYPDNYNMLANTDYETMIKEIFLNVYGISQNELTVCSSDVETVTTATGTFKLLYITILSTDYEDIEDIYDYLQAYIHSMPEPRPTLEDPFSHFYTSSQFNTIQYVEYVYEEDRMTNDACKSNRVAMTDLQFCDAVLIPYKFQFAPGSAREIFIHDATFEQHEYLESYRGSGAYGSYAHTCQSTALKKLGSLMSTSNLKPSAVVSQSDKHEPGVLLLLVMFVCESRF